MRSKKTGSIAIVILIFLPFAGVTGAYFTLGMFTGEEPGSQPEHITRFHAINESEIVAGMPTIYTVMIENREGITVEYELKVRLAGKEIHNQNITLNNGEVSNQRVSVPVLTGDYQKLEFLLYKNKMTYRAGVFQILPAFNRTSVPVITPPPLQNGDTEKSIAYTTQKNGSVIVYTFSSGERLDLNISEGNVSAGDAVYTTSSEGNSLTLIGEAHEKVHEKIPSTKTFLYPIILDFKDKKLGVNETLRLKNGYAITIKQITGQTITNVSLKLVVSKDNRTVREIISQKNSPIEYWNEIDDIKKYKKITIIPTLIDDGYVVFDITQYGDIKIVSIGDKYEEFEVVNITQDSIVMKNTLPLEIEAGKELSLIKGKIRIIV